MIIKITESQLRGVIKNLVTESDETIINEQQCKDPQRSECYPPCVRDFGEPDSNDLGNIPWGIYGREGKKQFDWSGYIFFNNGKVLNTNGKNLGDTKNMGNYFCRGNEPVLGLANTGKIKSQDSKTSVFKLGSKGEDVKKIQKRLMELNMRDRFIPLEMQDFPINYSSMDDPNSLSTGSRPACLKKGKCFEVNGIFDKFTDYAVKCFQNKYHLKLDGVVGNQTWRYLFGGGNNNPVRIYSNSTSTQTNDRPSVENPKLDGTLKSSVYMKDANGMAIK